MLLFVSSIFYVAYVVRFLPSILLFLVNISVLILIKVTLFKKMRMFKKKYVCTTLVILLFIIRRD